MHILEPWNRKITIFSSYDSLRQFNYSYKNWTFHLKLTKIILTSQIHTYYTRNSHAFPLPFFLTIYMKQFSVFY